MTYSRIISTGSYLPSKVMTNDDLAKLVDTSDEWIFTRTGIKERHIANKDELTSHMASKAAERAIESAGIDKDEVGLVIVATTTPDKTFPATATMVQARLGLKNAAAFDIQAVCSGFIYALTIVDGMMKSSKYKYAIVIGADKMSAIMDWNDRKTCVLFGDGAGAVVLRLDSEPGIVDYEIHSDGSLESILCTSGGVGCTQTAGTITMEGQGVYRHAIDKMASSITSIMQRNNLTDIDWLIPHQANVRIIDSIATRLKIDRDKCVVTVAQHANTSAATIPLALDAYVDKFKKGDTLVLTAAGGGFTWGSVLIRW